MSEPSRCPKCSLFFDAYAAHRCPFDELMAALDGLPLTAREESALRWLAGYERETVETLAGLFRRLKTT